MCFIMLFGEVTGVATRSACPVAFEECSRGDESRLDSVLKKHGSENPN